MTYSKKMAAEMQKNIFKILLLTRKSLLHVPTPAQRIYPRENLAWIIHYSLAFKKIGEGQ